MSTILLTGAAGFIGSWVAEALAARGDRVIGVDNFNSYYDAALKRARVAKFPSQVTVVRADVANQDSMIDVFNRYRIDQVCHLAAQAGVRYSLKNPYAYENANNLGTLNLLENCRRKGISSFIYASSSSVYGGNKKIPFSVRDRVDSPVSLYAATKKYNELLAHAYHHLFKIHCTGLRFFTVYGPWGRPDMALFLFTKAIIEGKPIHVYNHGRMDRDFTYVSDIVAGVLGALDKNYPYEVFNLGNSQAVRLMDFIRCLEETLGRKAKKKYLSLQEGDVPKTCADIRESTQKIGFRPKVSINEGIPRFVEWYRSYYGI